MRYEAGLLVASVGGQQGSLKRIWSASLRACGSASVRRTGARRRQNRRGKGLCKSRTNGARSLACWRVLEERKTEQTGGPIRPNQALANAFGRQSPVGRCQSLAGESRRENEAKGRGCWQQVLEAAETMAKQASLARGWRIREALRACTRFRLSAAGRRQRAHAATTTEARGWVT
jgi:hypothetical protein